jgi:hypothetical protein
MLWLCGLCSFGSKELVLVALLARHGYEKTPIPFNTPDPSILP